MMAFSKRKNVKKGNEKKSNRKGSKKRQSSEPESDPLFAQGKLDLKELLESQRCHLKPKESANRDSRLTPSLNYILCSPVALAYFMEFLETRNMKHLVDFWVAVEAFQVVARERYNLNKKSNQPGKQKEDVSSNGFGKEDDRLHSVKHGVGSHSNNPVSYQDSKLLQGAAHTSMRQNCAEATLHQQRCLSPETKDILTCSFRNNCSVVENNEIHSLQTGDFDREMKQSDLNRSHVADKEFQKSNNQFPNPTSSEAGDSKPLFQFQSEWKPFSANYQHENDTSKRRNPKQNSNYVNRIMSKQTRHRTKSTIIDAVGLYARYVSLDADEPIGIPSRVRNEIEAEICKDKSTILPDCFSSAQSFVILELQSVHQDFLESTFGNKYRLYILQERQLRLQDIMYCDNAVFYFMEYLDRLNYKEIMEFFLMTDSFEQNILDKINTEHYEINETVEDAMSIYDKYFSMRAKHQIIKDDKLRIVIENNICREDGPQPNCFCIPVAYAWTALKEVFLPRFLKSDMFAQLLESFCKSSIDSIRSDDVSSTTSSDSRSESMELLSSIATSIPDFLDKDVDDLWYRPDAGRLAMGYINQFGVFVSDKESDEFEEKEKSSSVAKIGKAMKNLLSKESEQEKERLAWEKARKIIEDIQLQSK